MKENNNDSERTFSIIKPDATERNLTGEICAILEKWTKNSSFKTN